MRELIFHLTTGLGAYQVFQACRQGCIILGTIFLARYLGDLDLVGEVEQYVFVGGMLTFFWFGPWVQSLLYDRDSDPREGCLLSFGWISLIHWMAFLLFLGVRAVYASSMMVSHMPFLWSYWTYLWGGMSAMLVAVWCYREGRIGLLYAWSLLYTVLFMMPYGWMGFGGGIESLFGAMFWSGVMLVGLVFVTLRCSSTLAGESQPRGRWSLHVFVVGGWPLAVYALIGMSPHYVDGWLVDHRYSSSAVFAIFRYGARELPLVIPLLISLSQAIVPILQDDQQKGLDEARRMSALYGRYLLPLLFLLLIVSKPIFDWMYGEAFASSVVLFDMMLMTIFFKLIFSQSILLSKGAHRVINTIAILEMLVNIVASLVLVRIWGLAGIVGGTLIAYAFEKIAQVWYVKRKYHILPSQYLDVFRYTLSIFVLVMVWIAKYWMI